MAIPSIIQLLEITPPRGDVVRLTSSEPINLQRPEIYIDNKIWICASLKLDGVETAIGEINSIRFTIALPESLRNQQNGDSPFIRSNSLVKRIFTDTRALESSNFTGADKPFFDQVTYNELKQDYFIVERIVDQNFTQLEAQLNTLQSSWTQILYPDIPNRCVHLYRGKDCGYRGTRYFDVRGNSVSNENDDVCGLRISDCELRFPSGSLPYGAIPEQIQNQEDLNVNNPNT